MPSPRVATVCTIFGPPLHLAGEVEHHLEVADGLGDTVAVGLVHHEQVGDLEQPGLVRLHAVAPARVHDDDGGVGRARDLDLDLPDADGLDRCIHGLPAASSTRAASGVASARPPRWPRVAIERM